MKRRIYVSVTPFFFFDALRGSRLPPSLVCNHCDRSVFLPFSSFFLSRRGEKGQGEIEKYIPLRALRKREVNIVYRENVAHIFRFPFGGCKRLLLTHASHITFFPMYLNTASKTLSSFRGYIRKKSHYYGACEFHFHCMFVLEFFQFSMLKKIYLCKVNMHHLHTQISYLT